MDPKLIAEAIRARRTELGLTQHDVSHLAGVQVSTIQDYESTTKPRTNRQPLVARKIAKALGWKPNAFELMLAGTDPTEVLESSDQGPAGVVETARPARNGGGAVDDELKDQIGKLLDGIGALTGSVAEVKSDVSALTQMHGDHAVRLHRVAAEFEKLETRLNEVEARLDGRSR